MVVEAPALVVSKYEDRVIPGNTGHEAVNQAGGVLRTRLHVIVWDVHRVLIRIHPRSVRPEEV